MNTLNENGLNLTPSDEEPGEFIQNKACPFSKKTIVSKHYVTNSHEQYTMQDSLQPCIKEACTMWNGEKCSLCR